MIRALATLCAAGALCAHAAPIDPVAAKEAPVIGILGVPALDSPDCVTLAQTMSDDGFSCFLSMYPEWVSAAAGRVVAIPYNAADAEPELLASLLDSINGVLLTGGELDFARNDRTPKVAAYMKTVQVAYDTVLRKHAAGIVWPMWGTCMGMQVLSSIGAQDVSVVQLNVFDSDGITLPVVPTAAARSSRLLSKMPAPLYYALTTQNVTVNLHHDGVDPAAFTENAALKSSFKLLGRNVDLKGKPFASIIEHVSAPIFATQFHPERPTFDLLSEYNGEFNRGYEALMTNDYFAHFFISLARKNDQTFTDKATWAWAEAHSSKQLRAGLGPGTPLNGNLIYMFTMSSNM